MPNSRLTNTYVAGMDYGSHKFDEQRGQDGTGHLRAEKRRRKTGLFTA